MAANGKFVVSERATKKAKENIRAEGRRKAAQFSASLENRRRMDARATVPAERIRN